MDSTRHSLRSSYYSASTERLFSREDGEGTEQSKPFTTSNEPPQVSPLRPVSKLLPKLIISIPINETSSSTVAVHYSIEDGCDDRVEWGERDSLCVSPLHLQLLSEALAPQGHPVSVETQLTNKADRGDDLLSIVTETYQPKRPVTKFVVQMRGAMEVDQEYKSSFTRSAAGSLLVIPSSTPKLRHTSLYFTRSFDMASLQSQLSASEPASNTPILAVPRTSTFDESKMHKTVSTLR